MFHRSERLLLRPPFAEDWRAVLDAVADEETVRNLARAPWPYLADDARTFVSLPGKSKYPRFLIALPSDGAVIGCIGLDHAQGSAELGYWIARPYWGRGYATEAGIAAVGLARLCGHTQLTAGHFADNPASGRVLQKIGFRPTGTRSQRHSRARGHEVECIDYALIPEAEPAAFRAAA